MKSMNDTAHEIKIQALFDEFGEIIEFLQTAFQEEHAAHRVEEGLWRRMVKLGGECFGAWLALFGAGDAGEHVLLADGRKLKRLEELHRREYRSVFGLFELWRAVYGTREGQKIEHVPLDKRLQLPRGKNSYLLQDWDQGLTVEMPYETVNTTVARILGFTQSVNTLERNQREMAEAASDFWQDRPTPPAEREGALLVCTADGKGVPMRGAAKAAREAQPPSTGGMRPGSKKMAQIGAVYTVDPYVRTPDEVLEALFRQSPPSEAPPVRPRPCFKHVRAALQRDGSDSTEPQTQEIFGWMAQEAAQRNPEGRKHVILLTNGQEAQWGPGLDVSSLRAAELTDVVHPSHASS